MPSTPLVRELTRPLLRVSLGVLALLRPRATRVRTCAQDSICHNTWIANIHTIFHCPSTFSHELRSATPVIMVHPGDSYYASAAIVVVQEESMRSTTVLGFIPWASQEAIPHIYFGTAILKAIATPLKDGL